MKLIKFKILYCWISKPILNKVKEIQINLNLYLTPEIDFKIDLSQYDKNVFNFIINLFGLFYFQICKTKETDHAGLWIEFDIFGIEFNYRKYDTKHWDYDKETWEIYED